MGAAGWKQLLEGWPAYQGEGKYPILPNSEFMPPVHLVRKPYGTWDPHLLSDDDLNGWPITEYEEELLLRPGLRAIAGEVIPHLRSLFKAGDDAVGGHYKLQDNPYWPPELLDAGELPHEHYVTLLPLALSQTQDDKARMRWTLFGNSEQGPARGFWRSFYSAPGNALPAEQALDFLRALLAQVYGDRDGLGALRVLPEGKPVGPWPPEELPSWASDLAIEDDDPLRRVRYLLTFRPFRDLPAKVRRRYLAGDLHLLPFPGSLLFWGISAYHQLQKRLRFAIQVPLLHFVERRQGLGTVRIPQAGWFAEKGPATRNGSHKFGPLRSSYRRTHRTARVHRYEDELVAAREHHLTHVLFSTRPEDIDLYHKPMARNVQIWTDAFKPLLHGPTAATEDIRNAARVVGEGGLFGYRFLFPAFRVGNHDLYWQRPLVAYLDRQKQRACLVSGAPTGYLTAYAADKPDVRRPVELWPRLLQRPHHACNLDLFGHLEETPPHRTLLNVRKLFDAHALRGQKPLPRSLARNLLTVERGRSLGGWLKLLPTRARNAKRAESLVGEHESRLEPERAAAPLPPALTYEQTATRAFEIDYWNTIAFLSAGDYCTKNNGDCVLDAVTQACLRHHHRDLDRLGDYLLAYYTQLVADYGMSDPVAVGELPFQWHTQYAFPWMGGWVKNQEGSGYERNLIVRIPGKDRSRAVVMADHYDTAYMYDYYEKQFGGNGARVAAPGADDNCSATAALMLGARVFLEMSRQGKLGCDVWLIHLTGEEYPAEGLGACRLCEWLVERTLRMRTTDGGWLDLADVRVQGLYVLDMIAHNNAKDRDVFQIAPGVSRASFWLAEQAHIANEIWNHSTQEWNRDRRGAGRGRRSADGSLPPLARYPRLRGEIRPSTDPRSTLYNTDGQAFSDVGVPVVLFMENYDIERVGYHDSHDTMEEINLDYGAALAAITIESVARAATEPAPPAEM